MIEIDIIHEQFILCTWRRSLGGLVRVNTIQADFYWISYPRLVYIR